LVRLTADSGKREVRLAERDVTLGRTVVTPDLAP